MKVTENRDRKKTGKTNGMEKKRKGEIHFFYFLVVTGRARISKSKRLKLKPGSFSFFFFTAERTFVLVSAAWFRNKERKRRQLA